MIGSQLGIETTAAKEAEGHAIGSACRHSGRALEDCFTLYPKAQKAAVFNGWRDMDAYMRENSIEVVAPVVPRLDPAAKKKKAADAKKGEEGKADEAKPEEGAPPAEKKDEAGHAAPAPGHSQAEPPPIPTGKGKMA
jgi:hypothetical protein